MAEDNAFSKLKGKATEYSSLLIDILFHSLLLCFFAILNFGVEWVVSRFQPHGAEAIIFRTVQVAFGATTLGSALIGVVGDLWVLCIKTIKKIEAANKAGS